ncbi:MAG: hypothetical protein AAI978_00895 [Candidatus Hodgkinia cicadicola]
MRNTGCINCIPTRQVGARAVSANFSQRVYIVCALAIAPIRLARIPSLACATFD